MEGREKEEKGKGGEKEERKERQGKKGKIERKRKGNCKREEENLKWKEKGVKMSRGPFLFCGGKIGKWEIF